MVFQLFAEVGSSDLRPVVERGVAWLVGTQNPNGSWNNGSCAPGQNGLSGVASIAKTCDALSAMLAAKPFVSKGLLDEHLSKSIKWILGEEKLLSVSKGRIVGWGYKDDSPDNAIHDLDSTCLTMETLSKVESISLPLLTTNARWLIAAQHREIGSSEDGKWAFGDSFRITHGLLEYYRRLKKSPLFKPSNSGNGNTSAG